MAVIYTFEYAPDCVGLDITIKNVATGSTVTTGELPGSASGGVVTFSVSLTEGTYVGVVEVPGGDETAGEKHPSRLRVAPGVFDAIASIEAAESGGGGGAETVSRGTLYLKATVVDQDVSSETWADGSGAPFALALDTERQVDAIPGWADETAGVYSIAEQGGYIFQLAGKGTLTYDDVPDLAYVDMYHNDLSGVNYGWASDGGENSAPFTPAEENDLLLGVKDTAIVTIAPDDAPVSLAGLVGDNYGDLTGNPVLSLEVLFSVTKIGSGTRYTAGDFA